MPSQGNADAAGPADVPPEVGAVTAPAVAPVVLREEVQLSRLRDVSAAWLLDTPTGRRLKVGHDFALITQFLAAGASPDRIPDMAPPGASWRAEHVDKVVARLGELDCLLTADTVVTKASRLRYHDLFAIQLDLWRPQRVGDRVTRLAKAIWSGPGIVLGLLIGLAAVGVLALDPGVVATALGSPVSPVDLGLVVLITWLSTVIHELSHGGSLVAVGGRPRRFGLMLFFFMPAAYCEVTDVWALPRPSRALVILAGMMSQFTVGGLLILWGTYRGPDGGLATLAGLVVWIAGSINLLPFVKLDGYLLVATLTETPFLLKRSLAAFADDLAALVGGTRPSDEAPWIRFFGFFTTFTPLVISVVVLGRLLNTLSTWGIVGVLIVVGLAGYALGVLLRSGWAIVCRALTGPRARFGVPALAASITAGLVGVGMLPVQEELAVAVIRTPDDSLQVVYGQADHCFIPDRSAPVRLSTNGVLLQQPVGRGVTDPRTHRAEVSTVATVPVTWPDAPRTVGLAQGVHVEGGDVPLEAGVGTVQLPSSPLAQVVFHRVWRCGW